MSAVRVSVHIEAPPERVYEYFTRADAMVRWMGEFAHLDPRPDGEFAVDVRGAPIRGRYVELDPPHRLVLTFGYAGSDRLPPCASTVEVSLTAERGGTRVQLVHHDLPEPEVAGHVSGWEHYFARLAVVGRGGDPGSDPGMPGPAAIAGRRVRG